MGISHLLGKIKFTSPARRDLLVFDQACVSDLENMVLRGIPFGVVCKQHELFHIGFRILVRFLFNLPKLPWIYLLRVRLRPKYVISQAYVLYLLAWIQCCRPKVVITFIDNDWSFHMLSRLYPLATFMAIQNGVRSEFNLQHDLPTPPHPGSRISMPLLYCFGQVESEIYPKYGHKVDRFIPIGSLRASWYRSQMLPHDELTDIDLLLISQWEETVMFQGRFPEIRRSLNLMNEHLVRFLSGRHLRFAVAMRGNNTCEREYFQACFGSTVKLLERSAMSTYRAIDRSDTIIVLDSTAGREAYGWGKKVLFVNYTGYGMYFTQADPSCYLEQEDFEAFYSKLEGLLNESAQRFRKRSKASCKWLMEAPENIYDLAHERIRNDLLSLLSPWPPNTESQ